jgi:hypothetical protein
MPDPGGPVEVTLVIAARPGTIFRYFTDPARFARWMGEASVLDPEPGGRLRVGHPTGQVADGTEVRLRHSGLPAGEPPLAHLAGWRHAWPPWPTPARPTSWPSTSAWSSG